MAKYALEGALRSHRELGKEPDEDWTNLVLAYMRVCAVIEGEVEAEELEEALSRLVGCDPGQSGKSCQTHLKLTDTSAENHRAFAVRLLSETAEFGEEADVAEIIVEIINNLPSVSIFNPNVFR